MKRKPFYPKPVKQSIDVVVTDDKRSDKNYSPFSRYPVKIPKIEKNKYFSFNSPL